MSGERVEYVLKSQLKIKGVVGKVGQGLSFVSLQRQVEAAKHDYSESTIVEAVIQSINPSIPLRGFLDTKRGLNLTSLMQILSSHFQECDTIELFNRLSNLVQRNDEDVLVFLLKATELKEKILHVSDTSDIKYSHEQVQRQFLKVVENRLQNEAIRMRIRSYLKIDVKDEELPGKTRAR